MYMSYLQMKARHEEMLRAAAQHRLATPARQTHTTRRHRAIAAPARRLGALRPRKLFSS
jgi:hypothetical protein